MRPISVAAVAATLCLAFVGSAAAASFPCGSFLHQLHHGKIHSAIQGEDVVSAEVAHWQRIVQADRQSNLPEPTKSNKLGSDESELAFWNGHLRYLRALILRIGQERCSRFHYASVMAWIRHRSGHLHADRFKLAGDPSLGASERIQYDTGGITALDPAGLRIEEIAAQHGVTIPEPTKP